MSVRHLPLTLLMLVISASPLLLMWLFAYVLRTVYIHPDLLFILMGFSTLGLLEIKDFCKRFFE